MRLWYTSPASVWNEALPIGNGHIAGMVFGGVENEKFSLNDETIWYRGPADRNNPSSADNLGKIRELLAAGDVEAAEDLVALTMFATPRDQSHYEVLGEMFLEQRGVALEACESYERELDLENALCRVSFSCGGVDYRREYFSSFARNVILARLTASKEGSISLRATLGRCKRFNDSVRQYRDRGVIMAAHAGGAAGVGFEVGLRVVSCDGSVRVLGETIVVDGATEVVLALVSSTDYWSAGAVEPDASSLMDGFDGLDFDCALDDHVAAYREQYGRVALDIAADEKAPSIPTDGLIACAREGRHVPYLLNLAFDYGRYLLLSSSQPGGLPANLQGIWCEDIDPIWGSKYTININTEMNYWMCGPADLPEAQLPLFDLLERMREFGRRTARAMYGARGFTCHHNTDGFADTAPQSHAIGAAVWPLTVPWLLTHIWEQYRFFGDASVLAEHLDMFKEALLFFEDYLFEYQGYLVTGPSASPENRYRLPNGVEGNVCLSPAIDNQILRFFFDCCVDIARVLGDQSDFAARAKALTDRLPPTRIGSYGQIQEWLEDYEEVEPGHRHISPLFGLYPGNEFDVRRTPELAAACLRTIERRTSNAGYLDPASRDVAIGNWKGAGLHASTRTGWSSAWLVHFNARLGRGDACMDELTGMLAHCSLPNLFSDHPPFQIDGNLGLTSGVCEMLLQSNADEVRILPALPDALPNGSFTGLRARGGFKVSASWTKGALCSIEVAGEPGASFSYWVPSSRTASGLEVCETLELGSDGRATREF